jgi:hypothetical protein
MIVNRLDPIQYKDREIKETISLEMRYQKNSSYLDFMRTKGNRYRLALLISLAAEGKGPRTGIFLVCSVIPMLL